MVVKQFGVKIAFLYDNLNEDIYMKQPIRFEIVNNKKDIADSCILKCLKDGEWIFILIYVDDILVATISPEHYSFVKKYFKI